MYKEILCDFTNLYKAYKLSHRGKTNSPDVIKFDSDRINNIWKIKRQLENKEWDKLFCYYRFNLIDNKPRVVDAMKFEGRIVQHCLCDNILKPYFENRLIKENCACRVDKGTDYAINLVKAGLIETYAKYGQCYILKLDAYHYFPSIKRSILKDLIKDFPDREILEMLNYIIDHCPDDNGLPIGNQTSQWFALYYLNKVDRIIKEKYKIKFYARYMDDLIVISNEKEKLNSLLKELRSFALNKLDIKWNSKTHIFNVNQGVSFLGWKLFIRNGKLVMKLDSKKKKIRLSVIRGIKFAFKQTGDYTNFYIRLLAVNNNLCKGNTYKLRSKLNIIY